MGAETKSKKGKAKSKAPNLAAVPVPVAASPLEGPPAARRGRKQKELPGLERSVIKAVEQAALDYEEARDERMERTKHEVAAKERLAQVLKEHNVPVYKFLDGEDEVIVEAKSTSSETVKVKRSTREDD